MHSGFCNIRSALPMNLKAHHRTFKIFSGARPDIERIKTIWTERLDDNRDRILDWPLMREWTAGAIDEPDEVVEIGAEF